MGVWVTVPGLLLLYFLTHTLGVSPFLAGLTLLLPKIIDVVVHPLLGSRSDRDARRSGHRRGLLKIGLLLAIAMAGMFTVPSGLSGASAALWVGGWFIAGNLLFACFQVPYLSTPSDLLIDYHERTRVFMFRSLVLSYLFTGTTTHLFLAALPFYTEHVFGNSGLTAVFMGAFLGPAVIAGPVWASVSWKIGKQRGLIISQVVFVIGSLTPLLGYGVVPAVIVVVLLGIAFAGLQLFAFSMVPDAVAGAESRGVARAGAYTGVWTATEATGTAIGPYLYSAALALGGFVATTEGASVVQPGSARTALLLGFTVVPAALMAAALVFQLRWTLDESFSEPAGRR
ncbi:MFS transporter [Actinoplanes sp. CA-015351]|uniref:MFS transporter n=1 Tax=Actinoplanes sp. CA-015351 TaxID=3239897 RepID=UPI003D9621E6